MCVCVGWKGEHQKSIKRSSDFYPRVRSLFCFVQSIPKKISFFSLHFFFLSSSSLFKVSVSYFFFHFQRLPQLFFSRGERKKKKRKFLKLQRPAPMAVYVCACLVWVVYIFVSRLFTLFFHILGHHALILLFIVFSDFYDSQESVGDQEETQRLRFHGTAGPAPYRPRKIGRKKKIWAKWNNKWTFEAIHAI